MNKDYDFLFQFFLPYSAVMFCGFTIPYMGFIEADGIMEYLDLIPKEHFHEFLMILAYFAISFLVPLIIISLVLSLLSALIWFGSISRICSVDWFAKFGLVKIRNAPSRSYVKIHYTDVKGDDF